MIVTQTTPKCHGRISWPVSLLLSTLAVCLCATVVYACDTPVYRYAMYNWNTMRYEIFYLYDGTIPDADASLNKKLEELMRDPDEKTNIVIHEFDASDAELMKALPERLTEIWKDAKKKSVYAIFTPLGSELYIGDLKEKDLASMFHSPARKKLADLLSQGHAGVMLVLLGNDEKKNGVAEVELEKFKPFNPNEEIEQEVEGPEAAETGAAEKKTADAEKSEEQAEEQAIASDKETDPARKAEATAEPKLVAEKSEAKPKEKKKDPFLKTAVLRVNRHDPQEKWLVRCLLSIERDLKDKELAETPMVFGIYGKMRSMQPLVGEGIHEHNLYSVAWFMMGPCSCEVQEQNPGMSILSQHDWLKAATTIAERFGSEEGNEGLLEDKDFFPDIALFENASPENKAPETDINDSSAGNSTTDASQSADKSEQAADAAADSQAKPESPAADIVATGVVDKQSRKVPPVVSLESNESVQENYMLRNVSIGIGVIVVVVFLLSFFINPSRS